MRADSAVGLRWYLALVSLVAATACGHGEAFSPGKYAPTAPFSSAVPRTVTKNQGNDRMPAWLPDESGFYYSFQTGQADLDWCLARMDPEGATQRKVLCHRSGLSSDSTDALEWPAPGAGGLAYVRAQSPVGFISPFNRWLEVTTREDPATATRAYSFPVRAPSGVSYDMPTHVTWLDSKALVFVGSLVDYPRPCQFCPRDTVVTGLELARLDLAASPPSLQVIPATQNATSVDASPDGLTIYFTIAGDTRVYQQALATGARQVLYDFGANGVARDVKVVGDRMVAVVGGPSGYKDFGGDIFAVDLPSGQATRIAVTDVLFKNPSLSPSGRRIIAEGYAVGVISPDLWLLEE